MQCKDIPDRPILEFLRDLPPWKGMTWPRAGVWFAEWTNSVTLAMPSETPPKLVLAKMRMLLRRGVVEGCGCGCRGDFQLTDKGRRYLDA